MARRKKNTAIALKNASPQADSGLFKIPPELRNNIYELVLNGSDKPVSPKQKPPGLLMTCKIINAEALQVYYSNQVFRFDTLKGLQSWLDTISASSLRSLRRIEFVSRCVSLKMKGISAWTSAVEGAQIALCRLDHMLQAKGVSLDCGAIKVDHLFRCYAWNIDEDGKRIVADLGSSIDQSVHDRNF